MPILKWERTSLYYEERGEGRPLLLIAGLGSDSATWAGVVRALAAGFRTVTFDHRGCGRSGPAGPGASVRAMAGDVLRLMNHLEIDRAHLIGHSLGGYIAQELAADHADHVDKLVLVSTAEVSSGRNRRLFEDFYRQLREEGYSQAWFQQWAPWLFSPERCADSRFVKAFVRRAASHTRFQSAEWFKDQIDAIAAFDSRGRLGAVRAETLVLEGKDDRLVLPDEARALAEEISGSRYRLLEGVGHSIHIEDPKLFVREVLEFLTEPAA